MKFGSLCVHEIQIMNSLPVPPTPYSEDEDPEYKPLRMPFKDDMDDFTNSPLDDKDDTAEGEAEGKLWIHPETEGWG